MTRERLARVMARRIRLLAARNAKGPDGFMKGIGSRANWYFWQGGVLPSALTLYRIAKKYNVSVDWLLGRD